MPSDADHKVLDEKTMALLQAHCQKFIDSKDAYYAANIKHQNAVKELAEAQIRLATQLQATQLQACYNKAAEVTFKACTKKLQATQSELAEAKTQYEAFSANIENVEELSFLQSVLNFFCESANNRNVQFGSAAAVVGAAVGFGLSYLPAVTAFVAGLLGTAATIIPPVATLVFVGTLVGVLLGLIQFAYDKYQANNCAIMA